MNGIRVMHLFLAMIEFAIGSACLFWPRGFYMNGLDGPLGIVLALLFFRWAAFDAWCGILGR